MKEITPHMENFKKPEAEKQIEIEQYVDSFCSGWKPETEEENIVFGESVKKLEISASKTNEEGLKVSYDKYKKEFQVNGQVVPKSYFAVAPMWEKDFCFEQGDDFPLEYKQMRKTYQDAKYKELTCEILSSAIARIQAEREKKKDLFMSYAYTKIAERFEQESGKESIGSEAERVVRSFLARISAEMQDLKISVHPANPYQDVAEKIDFIIEATSKKRGVGIQSDEHISQTVGIQFTVNKSKLDYKQDQIDKVKHKSLDVDDIILVSMNQEILSQGLQKWKKAGETFQEPAEYLGSEIREKLLRELFANLITQEEIERVVKKYS